MLEPYSTRGLSRGGLRSSSATEVTSSKDLWVAARNVLVYSMGEKEQLGLTSVSTSNEALIRDINKLVGTLLVCEQVEEGHWISRLSVKARHGQRRLQVLVFYRTPLCYIRP